MGRKTCELLFKGEGHNLPGFMIGRQLCVVSCFFIIARVTTMDVGEGEENVLDVPDSVQKFFDTGLMGAIITTIVASIAWQLVASAFPIAFLSNPITYFLLVLCLALEATGLCNGAWVLAAIHRDIAGFQRDEVYIGTAEERAARAKGDLPPAQSEVGHLTGGAYPAGPKLPDPSEPSVTERRAKVLATIKELRTQASLAQTK